LSGAEPRFDSVLAKKLNTFVTLSSQELKCLADVKSNAISVTEALSAAASLLSMLNHGVMVDSGKCNDCCGTTRKFSLVQQLRQLSGVQEAW